MEVDPAAALRRLPKVDEVLGSPAVRRLLERAPRWAVLDAVRDEIDRLRAQLLKQPVAGERLELDPSALEVSVEKRTRSSLRPVINATGVVLHTNLGRAPLAERAIERLVSVARGYSNLEYRLDEKKRGSRHDHVRKLLQQLTGAEEALVVNNCAAAVLLALSSLASGRGVIVSRGELVEIGGSFRVPDVMRASGARLVEVGTTNRTHLRDYQNAVSDDTALFLKVHRSNFAIVGFTTEVSVGDLCALQQKPVMVDLGAGALTAIENEPTVPQLIAEGADVVTFSGDKLLGGPQAGILVGTTAALAPMRSHPLLRALRPDKLTIAALEATLELYRDGATQEIPSLRMILAPERDLEARASKLCEALRASSPLQFETVRVQSAVGGGSLPQHEPWSWAVAATGRGAEFLEAALRANDPPIVARIAEDRLLLDVRTLGDDELDLVVRAFKEIPLA